MKCEDVIGTQPYFRLNHRLIGRKRQKAYNDVPMAMLCGFVALVWDMAAEEGENATSPLHSSGIPKA